MSTNDILFVIRFIERRKAMSVFSIAEHVVYGESALSDAIPYMKKEGKRPLIVTGQHVGKSPMVEDLVSLLNKELMTPVIFDGITGEPNDVMIKTGVEIYKNEGCDEIIGIGGGSPLDSAKAIAAMSVWDGPISTFDETKLTKPMPYVTAIPTTAGTGSETTKFFVITDTATDIKMLLKGDCLVPRLAVLVPSYTYDMPKSVTASTGLDALTHAVEAYTSKKAFDLTDTYAISAVKIIFEFLPKAYTNGRDSEARKQMMLAAFEAGVCINNSSVTIVHGMSRPIGALFHVPHGLSNAMLISKCLGFALDGAYERFGRLGKEIGAVSESASDEEASKALISKIEELVKICEVPTLKEYGVEEEKYFSSIEKMAHDAVASGSPSNTRKPVTEADCIDIYKSLYY